MNISTKAKALVTSLVLAAGSLGGVAAVSMAFVAPAEAASCSYSESHYETRNYNCLGARHFNAATYLGTTTYHWAPWAYIYGVSRNDACYIGEFAWGTDYFN